MTAVLKVILTKTAFTLGQGLVFFLIANLTVFVTAGAEARATNSATCFVDENANPLPRFYLICEKLQAFFGSNMPPQYTVEITTGALFSRFDPFLATLLIRDQDFRQRPVNVIAHEAAHISMAKLTHGYSMSNEFRFIDEGFATFFANEIVENRAEFKQKVLHVAAGQHLEKNVSFALVQDWKKFWGDTKNPANEGRSSFNYDAYYVGTSFIYFFLDTYGENTLKEFLQRLPHSGSLGDTFNAILKRPLPEIEHLWLNYLSVIQPDK